MSLHLEKLIEKGEITTDDVLATALKIMKTWGPEPVANRLGINTTMEIKTRRPQDWVLTDKSTGRSYVWENNGWKQTTR